MPVYKLTFRTAFPSGSTKDSLIIYATGPDSFTVGDVVDDWLDKSGHADRFPPDSLSAVIKLGGVIGTPDNPSIIDTIFTMFD